MTRFDCPVCGNGKLKPEEGGWRCNGLADPGHADLPLEACEYWVEKLPRSNRTALNVVNDHSMQPKVTAIDGGSEHG